jgi:group I intron endonuclease
MAYVYQITNEVNGHTYVGFTSNNIKIRFSVHKSAARQHYNDNTPLHNAIRKYGEDNFTIKTLYEGADALEQEDNYIKKYGYYNVQVGGQIGAVALGSKRTFTKEWKENIRISAVERSKEFLKWHGKDNPGYGKKGKSNVMANPLVKAKWIAAMEKRGYNMQKVGS